LGWQIGLVREGESKPRPLVDGIAAENSSISYDYWALGRDGDFFSLRSLFDERTKPNSIFIEARVGEVTDVLLYCRRLYEKLGISPRAQVRVRIEHSGLRGRSLTVSQDVFSRYGLFHYGQTAADDSFVKSFKTSLEGIDSNLVGLVKGVTAPMFELFDFAAFQDAFYSDTVGYVRNRR